MLHLACSTTISPGSTIATGTRSSTAWRSLSWSGSGCRACRAADSGRLLRHGLPRRTVDGARIHAHGHRRFRGDDRARPRECARRGVPGGRRQQVPSARQFDGAVCTFDSLNHILELRRIKAAFERTSAALKPGAPFAFDMLLESAYQTNWGGFSPSCATTTSWCFTGLGFDFRTRTAQCRITMFRLLDGVWRRSDLEVQERCYTTRRSIAARSGRASKRLPVLSRRRPGHGGQIGQGRTFVSDEPGLRRERRVEAAVVAQVGAHHAVGHAHVIAAAKPARKFEDVPRRQPDRLSPALEDCLRPLAHGVVLLLCQAKAGIVHGPHQTLFVVGSVLPRPEATSVLSSGPHPRPPAWPCGIPHPDGKCSRCSASISGSIPNAHCSI